MTTLPPPRREPRSGGIGLCLCGGGITGAMYEVGCLAALEDAFEGFRAADFDVFVGSSSGATVATALAGGMSAQRLYRALLDPADDFFPLQRHHLLQLDTRELKRVALSTFGALRRFATSASAHPLRLETWTDLDRFYDSLPSGIFTVDAYERFLADFMRRRGIPKEFDALPRKLVLIANDLDEGARVAFGLDTTDVPVPRAVAASSAIPVLYAPVRVDDRDCIAAGIGEMGHVDVPAELGCSLVVVINAMVPVRVDVRSRAIPTGHGPMKRVRDKGLLWVYNQAWRLMTQTRLEQGLVAYRAQHPAVDIVLLEPERNDAVMFMYSPMNFASRRTILEHAYVTTKATLKAPNSPLRKAFEARGIRPKWSQDAPRSAAENPAKTP